MAGTIILSSDEGVATSTQDFDYLVERIRGSFEISENRLIDVIYEPLDSEGMTYITLSDLSREEFCAFARAAMRAHHIARSEASYQKFDMVWSELLAKVREDERFFT